MYIDIEFPWFFCSRSHILQEISSLLEILFKKVILKIGSFAAILYEYNNKILKRIPIPFIELPKEDRQS